MTVETTRWDPEGMRTLAISMHATATALRIGGADARLALAAVGWWLPVESRLGDSASWVEAAAIDLSGRADQLEEADRTIGISLGFGVSIDIDVGSYLRATADEVAAFESRFESMRQSPLSADRVAEVASALREARGRMLGELLLVASVLPDLVDAAAIATLVEDLALTIGDLDSMIAAVHAGLGPEEVGIPAALFPPGYLAEYRNTVVPLLGEVARLEVEIAEREAWLLAATAALEDGASFEDVFDEFGEVPLGVDITLLEHRFALDDALADLGDARRNLAGSPLDTAAWLLASPPPMNLVAPVAGEILAESLLADGDRIAAVASLLSAAASPTLDQALFERLGAHGASMVPTWVAQEAGLNRPDVAHGLLGTYSQSLARAAQRGLSYTGGEVVWPDDPDWLVHPAELLRMADFPTDFAVDAAAALIAVYGQVPAPIFFSGPVFFAPDDDFNRDPRHIALLQLTSASAAAALVARLEADGTLSMLVDPETPYIDGGWDVAGLLSAARHSDDAVAALVAAFADARRVADPIALGAVALLDGNLSLLVPSGRAWESSSGTYGTLDRYGYEHDLRVGTTITEASIDAFLETILRSDAATAALFTDYAAHVGVEMAATSPGELTDRVEELGAAAGRIVRIRNDVLIERGADADAATALTGTLVSVVGGIAVAVGTGGWGAVAAVATGAAGDVAFDVGFDVLFPATSEADALRAALGDDRYDLETWRYLTVAALWDREPGFFGDTPPPTTLDGTLTSLTGPTLGDDACFAADPEALEHWYAWLHSLPDDLQDALDAIADTAHSRFAEEARRRD